MKKAHIKFLIFFIIASCGAVYAAKTAFTIIQLAYPARSGSTSNPLIPQDYYLRVNYALGIPFTNSTTPTLNNTVDYAGNGFQLLSNNRLAVSNGSGSFLYFPALAETAFSYSPTAVKTSAYTAAVKDLIPVNTTSGNVTITLPTAPADKSIIGVKMIIQGGTNQVSIAAGGSDVFNKTGGSTSLTLKLVNQCVLLQYSTSGAIWYVYGEDTPLSGLDLRYQTIITPGTTAQYFKGDFSLGTFPTNVSSFTNDAGYLTAASSYENDYVVLQDLGSAIKGYVPGNAINTTNGTLTMANTTAYFTCVYVPAPATITGVNVWMNTAGSYTSTGYNGVGLYTLNKTTGLLTLVASSTTSTTIWTAAAGLNQVPFSATYSAVKGEYWVCLLYQRSAETTAPKVNAGQVIALMAGQDFAHSIKLQGSQTSQTTLPTSVNSSAIAANTNQLEVSLY